MEPSTARRRYNAEFEGDTMRRAIAAVLVVFLATSVQAHAQLFTPQTTSVPAERVLIDTTLYVNPPDDEGLCMGIGAGMLTVVVKRTREAAEQPRPARFSLYGFMVDPDTRIEIPVSSQEVSTTTHINGSDHYCWSVSIDAPETRGMDMAHRGAFTQAVDVRITHRPD
jgi:hypothetical protein